MRTPTGTPIYSIRPIRAFPQASVAPVTLSPTLGMLWGPAGAVLAKEINKPEFEDGSPDFFRNFPKYLKEITIGEEVSDDLKLTLLKSCLTGGALKDLERKLEKPERVNYQEFWNWLLQKYGGDEQKRLRAELKALKPKYDGKMTVRAWHDYEGDFLLQYERLENPIEDEAFDIVVERIPEQIRRQCLREQGRRRRDRPTLKLTGIPEATVEEVMEMIMEVLPPGENPMIYRQGSTFLLRPCLAKLRLTNYL